MHGKPYGFRMTIERSLGRGIITDSFVCKTPHPAQANQQARYKTGFLRLISRVPLTRDEFSQAHPGSRIPHLASR
jgi:hypothetical protein